MTKKGFVLSWFYPPGNSSEGIVTYKLLSHSNYQYDVWTRATQNQNVWDRDVEEHELVSKNINILPCSAKTTRKWIDEAVAYFIAHRAEYDFIMTRSMPPEAHEVGLRIKQAFPDIKWIASFGDPLTDTPYLKLSNRSKNPYLLQRYIKKEKLSRVAAARVAISPLRLAQKFVWNKTQTDTDQLFQSYAVINDYVIKNSDLIILNNPYQLEHTFSGEYAKFRDKGVIIRHSYDPKLYPKTIKSKNQKITFTYTGHLDIVRNATPLLRAVDRLLQHDPKVGDLVEFNFYGHISDRDKLYILDHKLFNIINLYPDINYRDSLAKIKEADWALLFDANFAKYTDTNIYFPAKLADYIGADANILAVTQLQGATADIVREVGGGLVLTHSADEIFIYLSKIIYQHYHSTSANKQARAAYSADHIGAELDRALNGVLV